MLPTCFCLLLTFHISYLLQRFGILSTFLVSFWFRSWDFDFMLSYGIIGCGQTTVFAPHKHCRLILTIIMLAFHSYIRMLRRSEAWTEDPLSGSFLDIYFFFTIFLLSPDTMGLIGALSAYHINRLYQTIKIMLANCL